MIKTLLLTFQLISNEHTLRVAEHPKNLDIRIIEGGNRLQINQHFVAAAPEVSGVIKIRFIKIGTDKYTITLHPEIKPARVTVDRLVWRDVSFQDILTTLPMTTIDRNDYYRDFGAAVQVEKGKFLKLWAY